MTSSAIKDYPIKRVFEEPVAQLPVGDALAEALLESMTQHYHQLYGRRVWLACSGGRDSLALAALCVQLYHRRKLPFLVQLLHVDHGLQTDSSIWAEHVAKWAHAQALPCFILKVQVLGSDEQAARQARFQAMRACMNQQDVLLLAHHADDQAETLLIRLIQGAGVKGLSAMKQWSERVDSHHHYTLWRPWLAVRRETISRYAQALQLPYIDDPTNDTGRNVRSGLRRDVIPILAGYNPNVVENIARSAQLLRDAQRIVSDQSKHDLMETTISNLGSVPAQQILAVNKGLAIDKVLLLPKYRQRQLLYHWLAQDEPLPPSKQLVDDVLALIYRQDNDHQTQLQWQAQNQHYHIQRYRQQLYRLSQHYLDWLAVPLSEQTYDLPIMLADNDVIAITIRSDVTFDWHLQISLNADDWNRVICKEPSKLLEFSEATKFKEQSNNLTLKIQPLGRQQRVHTALAGRPQSGKKLYQTLGIPVWLRDSLVVVSLSYDDRGDELPLLLLSPTHIWALTSGMKNNLDSVFDNIFFSK